jgi:hypothetical protein
MKQTLSRKQLILASILSILLFGMGLASGLYVSALVAERQEAESAFLLDHVEQLERDLHAYQLQERFVDSLNETQTCDFAQTYLHKTIEGLADYWSLLPERLEEYERGRLLTPEYIALKERYAIASLRTWIIARKNYDGCGNDPIPILYFYSSDCYECVRQGEALDRAQELFKEQNRSVLVFTMDAYIDLPAVEIIKAYYGIAAVPSLVINELTEQGKLTTAETIVSLASRGNANE